MTGRYDLLIVGGGVNGAGIARDAAGRGLKVILVEQDDLGGATSSASTKLIHGGLRYLEHGEFRLVREALQERGRLLRIAPHIIRPLRFVMPTPPQGRPRWMIRMGLFLYDHLAGRGGLPRSYGISLAGPWGSGLKPQFRDGFLYSDCWVDDARLVILNAVSAVEKGADVRVHTRFMRASPADGYWTALIEDREQGRTEEITARAIINAAGPWVDKILGVIPAATPDQPVRLVKGSHIVVPRRFEGEHAYIFQNDDGRIMFAIPYEEDFTLIGTTDVPAPGDPSTPRISPEEIAYLCREGNRFLSREITPDEVVHSYSGVRPLYDDGAGDASSVTRDYVLRLQDELCPPILSIYGGKITTYRRLAEHVLEKLAAGLHFSPRGWTAGEPLPGGDIESVSAASARLLTAYPFLPQRLCDRLARSYGSRARAVLSDARSMTELGQDFGAGLTQREVDYLMDREWACSVEDILWRRTKLGLRLSPSQSTELAHYMALRKG